MLLCRSRRTVYSLSQHVTRRWASTTRSTAPAKVSLRTNGSLTLDIHHPLTAPFDKPNGTPKVLLYLPRGPVHANPSIDLACITALRKVWPYHLVQLNYRASQQDPYPTPIHDTLAGYDWVLENLLAKRAFGRVGRADRMGQVVVCGELVGGALATMLALTECHIGQPGVNAAAVNSPVLDWTDLAATTGAERTDDSTKLLKQRAMLFRKPEHYFDPFASPYLFFRGPGVDVPRPQANVPLDDLEHLAFLEREEFFRQHQSLSPSSSSMSEDTSDDGDLLVKRRARRVFPPKGSTLRLPPISISTGSVGPFDRQATDMAKVLRQSMIRQAGQSKFGQKVLTEEELDEDESGDQKSVKAEAERKVPLQKYDGSALWDGSHAGQSSVMDLGRWLLEQVS